MCLIAFAWRAHPGFELLVAANRDEWRDRPAEPAHWWPDHPAILAGRDRQAGGTWMGITRSGRFSAITNFRDPASRNTTAPSRGALVSDFLQGRERSSQYVARIAPRAAQFNGFNLLAGDGRELFYFGSREGLARRIEPGVYGLSNHLLDEPWPKVQLARERMREALAQSDPMPALFEMLSMKIAPPDQELPDTGVGVEWERRLASPLITGKDYGSRASTVLAVTPAGEVRLEERTRGSEGEVALTASFRFDLKPGAAQAALG